MEKGVWAYPWDLVPDPDCARRHADMGLTYVCVAARYHAVRALSYLPDGPHITTHRTGRSWLQEAASLSERYAAAGVELDAWIVCFHEDPAPEGQRVVNCFGDQYPWASCPRHPEARERILSFVEVAAVTGVFRTLELEAFGFYGFSHGCEHDKAYALSDPQLVEALSLCCCADCRSATGVEAVQIAQLVRPLLLASLADGVPPIQSRADGYADALDQILAVEAGARAAHCDDLLAEVMERVRGRARIRLQVSPRPRALGAVRPISIPFGTGIPAGDSTLPGLTTPSDSLPDEFVVPVWSSDPGEVRNDVQQVLDEVHSWNLERPPNRWRPRPRVLAGFCAIPPFCAPTGIEQAVETIMSARPDGLCAYHDGIMHPNARRAYAKALEAQS